MLAHYGIRVEPDLVIAIDGANDIASMVGGTRPGIPYTDVYVRFAMEHPVLNAFAAIGRHSQLLNVFMKLGERRAKRTPMSDDKAVDGMITEYLRNQDSMEAISRGINARFVSVLQPYMHLRRKTTAGENALLAQRIYAYRKEAMTTAFRRLDLELARHSRGPSAAFIDGTSAFDNSTNDCFIDEVHLTDQGKEILIRHIADQLTP